MTAEKLQQANELKKRIDEYDLALNCFEWPADECKGGIPLSRNPQLIIEVDDWDDCRENIKIPMVLSDALIEYLKSEIIKKREILIKEFIEL